MKFETEQEALVPVLDKEKRNHFILISLMTIFFVCGPLLIVVNSHILKTFPYPIFTAALGQVATFVVCACSTKSDDIRTITPSFAFQNVLPVGITSAGALMFGNALYMHVSVSFAQVLKSFTPILLVVLLKITGVEEMSLPIALCVTMISVGGIISCTGRPEVTEFGMFIGVMSSLSEALRLLLSQRLLNKSHLSESENLYYMTLITSLTMASCSVVVELPHFKPHKVSHEIGLWIIVASVLGVVVNVISLVMIKHISSVILKIMSMARNAALVLVSVVILGEDITWVQATGYCISIIFFGVYNFLKMQK